MYKYEKPVKGACPYKPEHDITFEWDGERGEPYSVNTWDDFHLIPDTRPVISVPSVRTSFVEVPGRNGNLDLTDALAGFATYGNREGTLNFTVDIDPNHYEVWDQDEDGNWILTKPKDPTNGAINTLKANYNWSTVLTLISGYLHGKDLKITLDDIYGYFFTGRVWVNQWESAQYFSKVSVDYSLQPYMYSVDTIGTDDWLWDPFDFEFGYIGAGLFNNLTVNGSLTVTFTDLIVYFPTVPTITATIAVGNILTAVSEYNGISVTLENGKNENPLLVIQPYVKNPTIEFIGHGTITIDFRRMMI